MKALIDGNAEGEPAQITKCPVCNSWLAIPESGLSKGNHKIYFVFSSNIIKNEIEEILNNNMKNINGLKSYNISNNNLNESYFTLALSFDIKKEMLAKEVDSLWNDNLSKLINGQIASLRPSRPGYFGIGIEPGRIKKIPFDFEIYCCNNDCELNKVTDYFEYVPLNMENDDSQKLLDGYKRKTQIPFLSNSRIPIPAYTVDDQIYHKCPTIVISTVDKIARLAFEPRATSIFGTVETYNAFYGYYSKNLLPNDITKAACNEKYNVKISKFDPPELIIQDELHLIEGPLGSLFGLYEVITEGLIKDRGGRPKYIASTATIKNADNQVEILFNKKLAQFPPFGLDINDNFFIKTPKYEDAWNPNNPGRIYMGVYTPGRGALTPIIRIWSRLLKTCNDNQTSDLIKYFWTIVGYFNSIRELGGGRSLYREDIHERLNDISNGSPRNIDPSNVIELSSRINSTDIPQILSQMETASSKELMDNPDSIFTTSMFGTGVDIPHLSLMIVNGQPKTTSQYIQASGRIGRSKGGLVITFYRSGRPRDLSHYEMFTAYHNRIYLDVEPSSASPFSEGSLSKASGPALVSFLRNMQFASVDWHESDGKIITESGSKQDFEYFVEEILTPRTEKLIDSIYLKNYFKNQFDLWEKTARFVQEEILAFVEYALFKEPEKHVVLGDPAHEHKKELITVYKNAPQSLRDIEETTGFGV